MHYNNIKSKRVIRSVFILEVYKIVKGINIAITINIIIKIIIICTNSYLLYKCLIKLRTTKEKRLIIDIIAIRQLYKQRELTKI